MNILRFENDKAPHAIVDFENAKLFEDEMLNNITSSVVLRSTFLRNKHSHSVHFTKLSLCILYLDLW